jgi:hypothetical protein
MKKSKANVHMGYSRIQERHYRTSGAIHYLRSKGHQAIRLGYNKEDAVLWLTTIGHRSTGQSKVTDGVHHFLASKGREAVARSEISDNCFVSLGKIAARGKKIYGSYLSAQQGLHRMAILSLRTERDVASLHASGRKWLHVCNEREYAGQYLSHRRAGAVRLIEAQRAAISFLRAIPQRIWANADRVTEATGTLRRVGQQSLATDALCATVQAGLKDIARKGILAHKKYRMNWAALQQLGENARRTHFEKNWTIQSYNKPLMKEEDGKIVQQDKDSVVIRRAWSRDDRLRAELEDAFDFLGLKPQRTRIGGGGYRDDDNDNDLLLAAVGSRVGLYQISKTNFILLTIKGKLLGSGRTPFDPSREFDAIDVEQCGYIGFEDVWTWLAARLDGPSSANTSGGGGLFGKKKEVPSIFSLSDILSVKERVILTLFERYEGRNARNR